MYPPMSRKFDAPSRIETRSEAVRIAAHSVSATPRTASCRCFFIVSPLERDARAELDLARRIHLTEEDAAAYQQARDLYRGFCSDHGISMAGPQGWQRFIQETSRSREGRAAFQAYREQI